jgi:hypothetical protein
VRFADPGCVRDYVDDFPEFVSNHPWNDGSTDIKPKFPLVWSSLVG